VRKARGELLAAAAMLCDMPTPCVGRNPLHLFCCKIQTLRDLPGHSEQSALALMYNPGLGRDHYKEGVKGLKGQTLHELVLAKPVVCLLETDDTETETDV
jgi:hypothetical protein